MPTHRSSQTGRKVSSSFAESNPATTIRESRPKDTRRLNWWLKHPDARFTSRQEIDAAMKAEKE